MKLLPSRAGITLPAFAALAAFFIILSGCDQSPPTAVQPEPPQTTAAAVVSTPLLATAPLASAPTASASSPTAAPTPVASRVASPTSTATTTVSATTTEQQTAGVAQAQETAGTLVSDLAQDAWAFLVDLTAEFSPRESATKEERAAADYLTAELQAIGLEAELQPFTFELLSRDVLLVPASGVVQRSFPGFPMTLSATGTVSGSLVDVGRAFEDDLPPEAVEGKIALIERGTITFEEKVSRVTEAGAIAAVVYNHRPGGFGGLLTSQARIPAVSVSQESGAALKEMMADAEASATVTVAYETHHSRNVIAEMPGPADDGRVVVLGAHYDTVPDTQGANDNGSGVATLMTVARELSGKQFPFTIRFVAFGAEEVGLFGSTHYVGSLSEEELGSIVAMLNFDVPGSGDIAEVIGSARLVDRVLEYAEEAGIEARRGVPLEGASSDHSSFRAAGVPVAFFLADDLSRINSPDDDLEFVKPELMGAAAALGLALLDALADR